MKKKIKDCTIQEIYDFCQKYTCCDDCPLYIFDVSGYDNGCMFYCSPCEYDCYYTTEIEIEEKENATNEDIKAYDSPTNGSVFLKTHPDSRFSNIAYDDGICYVYV